MNERLSEIISALNTADEKQNIDDIAKSCFTSTMQLQRDFYNVTGYSVGEYIRRLRLSNALCLIKNSDSSLADVAYSCGYSSQQALCREIKTILGTTATHYKNSNDYYFLSAMNENTPFGVEISTVEIPATKCLKFYSPVFRGIENAAVNRFTAQNPDYTGRLFGRNGKQSGNMLCYELYAEADSDINTVGFEAGDNYSEYTAVFAQTRVKSNEDEISAAWDYLYSSWLSGSMFNYSGQANERYQSKYFEEYLCKNARPVRLKLYLPVVRKKELLKITIEKAVDMCFLVSSCEGFNAEKNASRAVVEYLSENYPYVIKNAKNFYLRQDGDCYTCGVQIDTDIKTADNLHIIDYKSSSFAVLKINGIGDFLHLEGLLDTWLGENGFVKIRDIFAVYSAENSYEHPQMKIYCPIEIC